NSARSGKKGYENWRDTGAIMRPVGSAPSPVRSFWLHSGPPYRRTARHHAGGDDISDSRSRLGNGHARSGSYRGWIRVDFSLAYSRREMVVVAAYDTRGRGVTYIVLRIADRQRTSTISVDIRDP